MSRTRVAIKTLVMTNLHITLRVFHNSLTVVKSVEVHIIVLIVKQGTRPSMIRLLVTIKILVMTNLHFILISNNSLTVVRSVEVPHYSSDCQTRNQLVYKPTPDFESHFNLLQRDTNRILEELLRTLKPNSPIREPKGSDDYTEVPFDDEQILRQHYTAHVTPLPLAYTPPLPFLITMEPADTLLMGDEDISTILARETDKFIKSSVDDLVPILMESEVTLDSNLECDMHVNTPLPTTDVKEENFDINSPLGEYVVDFLINNEDIAGIPRHLVKRLFSHLVKNPSFTKRMSDEPLGDDSKLRSYDVTFSNSLFNFNDDFTLCNDNLLFDEEFEDISSLDPPKSAPLNYEPLDNPDSVSRSLETSELILEDVTPPKSDDSGIVTLGCDFKAQSTSYRKRLKRDVLK
ncbi:hypothetical protein Tco_0588226 [Tanacetum coccineum]